MLTVLSLLYAVEAPEVVLPPLDPKAPPRLAPTHSTKSIGLTEPLKLNLSTCSFTLGKFALAIVLVLLPPICPLAPEPEVESKNLPSIFCQVVLKYLVAGLLDKVVM